MSQITLFQPKSFMKISRCNEEKIKSPPPPQFFLVQNFCLDPKFLKAQHFLRPNNSFGHKIFWTQILLGPNFFFLDPKLFSDQKFFQTQNELQWKMIYGVNQQSLGTWGIVSWQGKRFYFNWIFFRFFSLLSTFPIERVLGSRKLFKQKLMWASKN